MRLQQILNNLIGNAIKFTERGTVTVSALNSHENGSDFLRLVVQDTGIGIPADKHEMIFNKFSQADVSTARKYGGTGLGLAITKHLVDIMDGKIKLESEIGAGTTFTIDIPLEVAQSPKIICVDEFDVDAAQDFSHDLPILVVDDHPINLLFMRKALMKLHYTNVDEAHSGLEAVRMYEKKSYSLILMDCQMPEMDGYEASMHIRLESGHGDAYPIIVAITADAMKGAKERCLEAGMDDYISKPIDVKKMQNVLAKWLVKKTDMAADSDKSDDKRELVDFDRLSLYSEGNDEELKYMIDLFLDCADEAIAALQTHSNDNHDAWKKAAHKLKGSAANFGAGQLSDLCAHAENLEVGQMGEKDTVLKQIHANYEEVLKALFYQYP